MFIPVSTGRLQNQPNWYLIISVCCQATHRNKHSTSQTAVARYALSEQTIIFRFMMILFQDVERNVNLFSKFQSYKHWLMYILPVSVCMCDPATACVALSTGYDDHMCGEQASSPWRRSAELPWKRGGECIGVMLCHLTHTHTHGHANTDAVSRACCMNTYFKHRFECWRRIRRISHRCVTCEYTCSSQDCECAYVAPVLPAGPGFTSSKTSPFL